MTILAVCLIRCTYFDHSIFSTIKYKLCKISSIVRTLSYNKFGAISFHSPECESKIASQKDSVTEK